MNVLAKIARHKPDVDSSDHRLDAQGSRIVRIPGFGFEDERISGTEAPSFLLRRGSAVA